MFSRIRKRGTTTWEREANADTPLIVIDAATTSAPRFLESKASNRNDETDANGRPRSGEQRQKHNAVERRRKKAIKEAMDELVDLLPEKQNKPTQLSVLKAAIDYIKQLQQENDALRGGGRTGSPVPAKRQRLDTSTATSTTTTSSMATRHYSPSIRSSSDAIYSSSDDDCAAGDTSPVPFATSSATQPPVLQLPVYSVTMPTMFNAPPPSNTTTFVPPMLSGSFLQYLQQADVNTIAAPAVHPQSDEDDDTDEGARGLAFLPAGLATATTCAAETALHASADFDSLLARFLSAEDSASSV